MRQATANNMKQWGKYTDDFRRDVVTLVTEQGYTVSEAARMYGVNVKSIRKWRQRFAIEKSYSLFIAEYMRLRGKRKFYTLKDYLVFLENNGIRCNLPSCGDQEYFSFETKSRSTVQADCISLLRKSAELGYFVYGDRKYKIQLRRVEYYDYDEDEIYFREADAKWIEEDNSYSGVYRLFEGESIQEFVDCYLDLFPLRLSHIEVGPWSDELYTSWERSSDRDIYMSKTFKYVFIEELRRILDNLYLNVCSDSAFTLVDGTGISYYLLFGYNSRTKQGEGLLQEYNCH